MRTKKIVITQTETGYQTSIEGMSSVELAGHAKRLSIIATNQLVKELDEGNIEEECDCPPGECKNG